MGNANSLEYRVQDFFFPVKEPPLFSLSWSLADKSLCVLQCPVVIALVLVATWMHEPQESSAFQTGFIIAMGGGDH